MKTNLNKALAALALIKAVQWQLHSQGTAFTDQGGLNFNRSPAVGSYDFRFRVSSGANANNFIGTAFIMNAVTVTNGLFLATQ